RPQPAPDAGRARIIGYFVRKVGVGRNAFSGPEPADRLSMRAFVGVVVHRSKFEADERLLAQANSALPENGRAWTVQADRRPQAKEERRQQDERERADDQVKRALSNFSNAPPWQLESQCRILQPSWPGAGPNEHHHPACDVTGSPTPPRALQRRAI